MIHHWAHEGKMEFNPDPTKQATETLFSCEKVSPIHPQQIFNGTAIVKVNEQKHLGLILQPGLSSSFKNFAPEDTWSNVQSSCSIPS